MIYWTLISVPGRVTILILIDGFLQSLYVDVFKHRLKVTILILIDGFLQCKNGVKAIKAVIVTILILIDGFLQYKHKMLGMAHRQSQSLF